MCRIGKGNGCIESWDVKCESCGRVLPGHKKVMAYSKQWRKKIRMCSDCASKATKKVPAP